MKLLLIEDEIELSEALVQILTNNKYVVDAVYDGEDGLNYALTDIYDVIVLDIMLPKLDGLSILKKLRKEGILTPIIMLTAKTQIEDRVLGLDLGADDYLSKPFAAEELLARLRSITRRKGNGKFLEIKGARENNLKNVNVKFPLGKFICVTGVSGSGKSSLINEILYKLA